MPEALWSNVAMTSGDRRAGGRRRPTVHDVARAAGVSPPTVSRVLAGGKPVSAELSDRVRAAAAELGYRPNPAAQVLVSGQHGTIGVVLPDLANPFFSEVLKGVTSGAGPSDTQVMVVDADEDPTREHEGAERLARWVDGLVLCSPRMPDAQLAAIADTGVPLVLVNRPFGDDRVDTVLVDYHSGMAALADHLAALGHRRVAYLAGPSQAWSEQERERALRDAGRALDVVTIPCGSGMADGHAVTDEALGHRPTAILAFSDYVALGVLTRLTELGVPVPGGISLTGFDDIPLAAIAGPGLTTATVRKQEIGALAWRQLLARMDRHHGARTTTVPAELVRRGSTGVPAS